MRFVTLLCLVLIILIGSCAKLQEQKHRDFCETGFSLLFYKDNHFCVSNDYYKKSKIRMPLGYWDAIKIAKRNGWSLPDKDMVNFIWSKSDCKLDPIPMKPGPKMVSFKYIKRHNDMIEEQLQGRRCKLIAGHKKDVISGGDDYVTIYGWHRKNGRPIQPVYSGHEANYYDYSHGIRFIYRLET